MGLGARSRRLFALVGIGFLRRSKLRRSASRLQGDSAADLAAPSYWRQADCDDRCQPQSGGRRVTASGAKQEHTGDHRRQYCRGASSVAIPPGRRARSFNAEQGSAAARESGDDSERQTSDSKSTRLQPQPACTAGAYRAEPSELRQHAPPSSGRGSNLPEPVDAKPRLCAITAEPPKQCAG
jgi:hypothetical protein